MTLRKLTYHVHTTPDLVSAKENWAPHSIWHTPWPFSLSMFWGMLQPSLPPRPNFPKSPSPQENTKPRFKKQTPQVNSYHLHPYPEDTRHHKQLLPSSVRASVCASLLPHATWMTLWPRRTFTYSITNVKTEWSTGTGKAMAIFPQTESQYIVRVFKNLDLRLIFTWKTKVIKLL